MLQRIAPNQHLEAAVPCQSTSHWASFANFVRKTAWSEIQKLNISAERTAGRSFSGARETPRALTTFLLHLKKLRASLVALLNAKSLRPEMMTLVSLARNSLASTRKREK